MPVSIDTAVAEAYAAVEAYDGGSAEQVVAARDRLLAATAHIRPERMPEEAPEALGLFEMIGKMLPSEA